MIVIPEYRQTITPGSSETGIQNDQPMTAGAILLDLFNRSQQPVILPDVNVRDTNEAQNENVLFVILAVILLGGAGLLVYALKK